jgi:cysteine-rich repeat protein
MYQLINNVCVFCDQITGYAVSKFGDQCIEICGDGVVFKAQCDDGNTKNGDGCSSKCLIEVGWKCLNNGVNNKSSCQLTQSINMNI